jgi:hypothetical protein
MTENSEKYRAWQQSQDLKLKTAQKEMRKQTLAMQRMQSELAKQQNAMKQRNAQFDMLQKKMRDADLRNAKNAARHNKDAKGMGCVVLWLFAGCGFGYVLTRFLSLH